MFDYPNFMKIHNYSFLMFVTLLVFLFPSISNAAFTADLYYGMDNNVDVITLQKFLNDRGLYNGPITGNFYEMTEAAVKSFQMAQDVSATGYFGPLTRERANLLLNSAVTGTNEAQISITYPINGESVMIGNSNMVRWQSSSYSSNALVNINLLKQISVNPNRYELVRVIAANTPNDGSEAWVPGSNEVGTNFIIEVTCGSATVNNGCVSGKAPQTFAIVNTGFQNLANPLNSFNEIFNFLKGQLQ